MLVSAKSLEELEAKLASIPEEKRRAIVLAGAHRNERTHVLARLHHREWEEFGVVAVNVPFDWTPQGFWANAYEARPKRIRDFFRTRKQRDRVDHERIVMRMAATPWDYTLVDFLYQRFKVPVVTFHSTPLQYPPTDLHYPRWKRKSGPFVFFTIGAKSPVKAHPAFQRERFEGYLHPAEVSMEFYSPFFQEQKPSKIGDYAKRKLRNLLNDRRLEIPGQSNSVVTALLPRYIDENNVLSKEGLRAFESSHSAKRMKAMLKLVARNGLLSK